MTIIQHQCRSGKKNDAGPARSGNLYWPERNLTFAFNTRVVPPTRAGFPCRYGSDSEYSGYLISATTLKKASQTRADGCRPQRYLDSERVPFFVLPAEKFEGIELGDITVGFLRTASGTRTVYGIAADTGPYDHFGEGSIAFNNTLLDEGKPIASAKDVDKLDINL